MDYKEEYEAMVKKCRELHESGNALTKQLMEIVCPQLKESEDERIRKAIIHLIERRTCQFYEEDGIPKQDMYAWLEKQKEQKPAEWNEKDNTILDNIIAYKVLNIDDLEWLKSLPERFNLQPHWKPSEEQMEALELAIEGKWDAILPTGYMSRRLEDLAEGLANTFGVECNLKK